jgi:hypothetical protein
LLGSDNFTFPVLLDQEIEDAFEDDLLSEAVLRSFLSDFLNEVLSKVQKRCDNEEMREIISRAYPTSTSTNDSASSVPAIDANAANSSSSGLIDMVALDGETATEHSDILNRIRETGSVVSMILVTFLIHKLILMSSV